MLLFLKFLQGLAFMFALVVAILFALNYFVGISDIMPFIPMYGAWPAMGALVFALLMGHWMALLEKPVDIWTTVRYLIYCAVALMLLTLAFFLPPSPLRTTGYYTVWGGGAGFVFLLLAFVSALLNKNEADEKSVTTGS